jgi:hypothetical protein
VRQFSSTGFRIWNLGREAKIVYTCFGFFSLLALASSALFYEDLVAGGTSGIRAYYAGEARPAEARSAPAGGPQLELPGDDAATQQTRLTVAVSYRKLLEVTHFHLFTVPVFLLIIAHLFMLTGLSPTAKAAWIVAGWASALVHLAAPWVVRYGGGGWAWLYAASGAALAVASAVLTLYPIWAMWRGPPAAQAGDEIS